MPPDQKQEGRVPRTGLDITLDAAAPGDIVAAMQDYDSWLLMRVRGVAKGLVVARVLNDEWDFIHSLATKQSWGKTSLGSEAMNGYRLVFHGDLPEHLIDEGHDRAEKYVKELYFKVMMERWRHTLRNGGSPVPINDHFGFSKEGYYKMVASLRDEPEMRPRRRGPGC